MSLKAAVSKRLIETVFAPLHQDGSWKVLVMDQLSSKMLSACLKMHDLVNYGITLVESLEKKREPLPALEAIYIITPNPKSIQTIVNDFADSFFLTYKCAHVFFTEVCSDFLLAYFREIKRYVKSLKEIDMAFIPLESQVFTLNSPKAFDYFYRPSIKHPERVEFLEKLAEQLATMCAALEEYPNVRYRAESSKLADFSRMLKDKLDLYKKDDPKIGEGSPQKCRSQLLLLDRGFDITTALLHELTYQAMAYDVLEIENDVFKYEGNAETDGEKGSKEALLDEDDEMWVNLRHLHIADVTRTIAEEIKNFSDKEKLPTSEDKMKDLQKLLKKAPEYQKQVRQFLAHFSLAESCMKQFRDTIGKLCDAEQDMATGQDKEGHSIKDAVRSLTPLLHDDKIKAQDKIRLILLYVLFKDGINEESMQKFFQHGNISIEDRKAVLNLVYLGVQVIREVGRTKAKLKRKDRDGTFYLSSRWVPYLKDLVEFAISDSLSDRLYPYVTKRTVAKKAHFPIISVRRKNDPKKEDSMGAPRDVPRLIVFVIGGVTYSETRAVYEIANAYKDWDVFIGSDCILTPSSFISRLSKLSM